MMPEYAFEGGPVGTTVDVIEAVLRSCGMRWGVGEIRARRRRDGALEMWRDSMFCVRNVFAVEFSRNGTDVTGLFRGRVEVTSYWWVPSIAGVLVLILGRQPFGIVIAALHVWGYLAGSAATARLWRNGDANAIRARLHAVIAQLRPTAP